MFKALELVGFKSFADKTRFEFPQGITVVVGPNGSGKSNVVDAIKWVLGEQSVKSLRGKEMADVIFNGSGTRKPMNVAEITLTLDNSNHLLPIDSPQVHITRRIYRSGEGEYLINRQPSRLRDIRDLLSGTGLGTQAYSIIEQGKVDVLLQSSTKDRRVIFEEAAGISRFKARKMEALRRLERVEQNLLRLSDIVDEVDSRLRSVRLQAGKARRYKEFTDRLQNLRTQASLVDWRRLSERLGRLTAELAELTGQRDGGIAEAEALDARSLEAEHGLDALNAAIREVETHAAANRERIAAAESTIEHERARSRDIEEEIDRRRRQLAAMSARAGGLEEQIRQTQESLSAAEEQQRSIARRLGEGERQLTDVISQLDRLRGESHDCRGAYLEQMRTGALLGNQTSALESQAAAELASRERIADRLAQLGVQLGALGEELQELGRLREELAVSADHRLEQLNAARTRFTDHRQQRERRAAELAQLQQRAGAAAGRISLLEELEKRYEGLSPGVKDVLTLSRTGEGGPWKQVCGLLADLFRVSVEAAPLVEAALGDCVQHVVVRSGHDLLDHLQQEPYRLSGRVGLLWLESPPIAQQVPSSPAPSEQNLEGQPGVLGRADRFIETEPVYEPLARRLLGRTWIVENLRHALAFARSSAPGLSFVTLAGEFLAADGTLIVGPRNASSGLISRRSELRVLKGQLEELEAKIEQGQSAVLRLDQQVEHDQKEVDRLVAEHQQAADSLGRHCHKITAAEERRTQLGRQQAGLEVELSAAVARHEAVQESLAGAHAKKRVLESALADMESRLAVVNLEMERLEADRQARGRDATEAKVDLAKSEERLGNLRARMRQVLESQEERRRAIAEGREELARCAQRADESQRNILGAEGAAAQWYLHKEALAARTIKLLTERETVAAERAAVATDAQRVRGKVRKLEEKIHAADLAAGEIRHELSTLAGRIREDYGVELSELEQDATGDEQHRRAEVQQEIDALRQKINSLGNVNLEALEELNHLEERHSTLSAQFKDLSDAKNALARIIEKINADSRRLFIETLETVRGHFGELFKNLFGGGQADIVLEEGVDILESGIEIVARPPGKETRSISLLSGGEKTLTCVALLLAMFRSRPSPFCVLDEVDAALDEANIDRFTKVLKEFLTWTQFIIVTHSKKTMTCATSMYGVTMQESGVSKQVSVRFEDVSDNGEIRLSAAVAADPPPTGDSEGEEEIQAA